MAEGSSSRFGKFEKGESSGSNNFEERQYEGYEVPSTENDGVNSVSNNEDEKGKKVLSEEQIEVLEQVFAIFRHPSVELQKELIQEYSILSDLEIEDIKIWFRERRVHEKRNSKISRLRMVCNRLTATYEILNEEKEIVLKEPPPMMFDHDFIRNRLRNLPPDATDISSDCAHLIPELGFGDADDPTGIMFLAEQIKADFLFKAAGGLVDWVHIPVTKLGPDAVRTIDISRYSAGVAARAYDIVSVEPKSVMEILKHRLDWSSDCRKQIICVTIPAGAEGKIELIYTQFYAPVMLVPARDFWTIRYTSTEGGGFVVCERSVPDSCSHSGPSLFFGQRFTTAEMLNCGFWVQPVEGRGSSVHIVNHLDLQASSVLVVIQPIYKSSKLVAENMSVAALDHIKESVEGKSLEGEIRSYSRRLSRGFNDAINSFGDDGWEMLKYGGATDLTLCANSTKNFLTVSDHTNPRPLGGILCVKGFVILNNVSSASLIRYLREHRFQWADVDIDAYCAASLHAESHKLEDLDSFKFSSKSLPLGQTTDENVVLDMIQLEGLPLTQNDVVKFGDVCFLQICNGIVESDAVACSELLFAPHCPMLFDDAPLLASGFRVFPLESKTWHGLEQYTVEEMANLTSTTGKSVGPSVWGNSQVVATVAFQFPFGSRSLEEVEIMGSAYVRRIFSSLESISLAMQPPRLIPSVGLKLTVDSPGAVTLASWVCKSYRLRLYEELLRPHRGSNDTTFKRFWHHPQAILCCSFKPLPICLLANQAAVDMLETTLENVQDISLYQIFESSRVKKISSVVAKIVEQGHALLSSGICESLKGRRVSYDQALAWKVIGEDATVEGLAIEFYNWSFC